jgi:HK97 family phage major capsid protein
LNDTEFDQRLLDAHSDDIPRLVRGLSPAELDRATLRWNDKVSRLSTYERLTAPQQREFDAGTWLGLVSGQVRNEQRDAQLSHVRSVAVGGGRLENGFGGGNTPSRAYNGDSVRDQALRTIDTRRDVDDATRHLMASTIDRAQPAEQERYARYIRAAGDAAYESAFSKLLSDPINGHRLFDDAELRAFQRVQSEARALSLTDSAGGYLIPATVDFSIQLTGAGSVNPMRQVCRTVTTTGDTWSGITSAGATASWDAEAAQVSDDSPTFGNPSIPVYKGACYVQASFEVAADASIGNVLAPIFADARDQLEATAHTLGTGTGQPTGLITALVAAGGSTVLTSAASAITFADVVANQNALPARWRPRARWMANLSIINQGRALVAGSGLTTPIVEGGANPTMLGWPVVENSTMDGTIAAGTTNDYVLLSGDFSQFVIVDRIGLSVVYNPVVVGANGRPTGEAGWYAYWRTGSGLINADAFRLTNYSG